MNTKTKVFVLNVDNAPDNVNAFEIQNWDSYQRQHNKLTEGAKAFIQEAINQEGDYNLESFSDALNLDTICLSQHYIFITDLYEYPNAPKHYKQVCNHCGSEEVARWVNVNNEEVYSSADEWCMECESETTIINEENREDIPNWLDPQDKDIDHTERMQDF